MTARPDTRRRRELQSPGRRFGPCTSGSTASKHGRTRAHGALFVGVLVSLLVAGTAAIADDDGPIMLNNDDVARLHGQPAAKADAAARQSVPAPAPVADVAAPASPENEALLRAQEAELRSRLDRISQRSMGAVDRALDERTFVDTSADPAEAAPTAPAAPMPGGGENTDTDEAASAEPERRFDPTPACVYGPNGHLLHAPDGRECAPVRQSRNASEPTSQSSKRRNAADDQVGCVYGSRGQLLYESRGVECAATAQR